MLYYHTLEEKVIMVFLRRRLKLEVKITCKIFVSWKYLAAKAGVCWAVSRDLDNSDQFRCGI